MQAIVSKCWSSIVQKVPKDMIWLPVLICLMSRNWLGMIYGFIQEPRWHSWVAGKYNNSCFHCCCHLLHSGLHPFICPSLRFLFIQFIYLVASWIEIFVRRWLCYRWSTFGISNLVGNICKIHSSIIMINTYFSILIRHGMK